MRLVRSQGPNNPKTHSTRRGQPPHMDACTGGSVRATVTCTPMDEFQVQSHRQKWLFWEQQVWNTWMYHLFQKTLRFKALFIFSLNEIHLQSDGDGPKQPEMLPDEYTLLHESNIAFRLFRWRSCRRGTSEWLWFSVRQFWNHEQQKPNNWVLENADQGHGCGCYPSEMNLQKSQHFSSSTNLRSGKLPWLHLARSDVSI